MEAKKIKKIIQFFILIILILGGFSLSQSSNAAIRKEFNYQGKLTDSSGLAVADGAYDITFKIYDQAGGGTALWTESWTDSALFTDSGTVYTDNGCGSGIDGIDYTSQTNESTLTAGQTLWNTIKKQSAVIASVDTASNFICIYAPASTWETGDEITNRVYIKNGLFSVMVGSVTAQTLNFSGSDYYLGVTIGTDAEMSPRKKIGSVPQAWNANNLIGGGIIDIDNTSASQDAANINYDPTSGAFSALSIVYGVSGGTGSALTVTQSGTGNIVDFKDGSTSVFTISDGGNVMMTGNLTTPSINNIIYVDGTTYAQTSAGIQAAIDALPAEGGKVILPEGTYDVNSLIAFSKSNVTLEGVGKSTIIRLVDSYNADINIISDSGHSGIVISNLTIDCNQANQSSGGAYGIYLSGTTTYARVDNCWFIGIASNRSGVESYATYLIVTNCHLSGSNSNSTGLHISGDDNVITDNVMVGTMVSGIYEQNSDNNIISGNDISSARITLWNSTNSNITNNNINSSYIYLRSLSNNNTISGNSVYNSGAYSIILDNSSYNVISANALESSTGANVLSLTAASSYNTIDGNNIKTGGTYGVQEAADTNDYNSVTNNTIIGATTSAILSLGIHDTISGNKTSDTSEGLFDIVANSGATQTALTVTQNGTGNIVDFKDGTGSVLTISDGGGVVMSGGSFLQNASDPLSIVGSVACYNCSSVFVSGKYAYTGKWSGSPFGVVDVSNPSSPVFTDTINSGVGYLNGPKSIAVSGKYAYIASSSSFNPAFYVIDVSNPHNIFIISSIIDAVNLPSPNSLYLSGQYAYVVNDNGILNIIDISDPLSPYIVNSLSDSKFYGAESVYIYGKYAYIPSNSYLSIVDVSDPYSLSITGYKYDSTLLSYGESVYVSGGYAYFLGTYFAIIDISNPASPSIVTTLSGYGGINQKDLVVSGRYAYTVSRDRDFMAIIDISVPSSPSEVGRMSITDPGSIHISGIYSYVSSWDDTLYIIDISGFNIPAANIGDLNVSTLDVTENVNISNNLYAGNGLNVGSGGIYSHGGISSYISSTSSALTVTQSGTGNIVDFKDGTTSVFTITDGGNIAMSGNFTTSSINNIHYVDGTKYTQDSAGIQEAIDDLPSTGGKVILPAATYNVDKAMDIAIADDGGAYTDQTTAANEATANDMTLLPAAPAVDDAYYFGYDYRTRKVTLNISTAGVGTYTITWEYYDGSTWTALSGVTDGTTGFTVSGVNDITYTLPTDWAKATVNSIEKYFIRARVSAFTDLTTQPLGAQAYGHGSIIIDKSNVTLEGVGDSSEMYAADNFNTDVILVGNGSSSYSGVNVRSLKINGNAVNNSSTRGVYLNLNISNSGLEKLNVYNNKGMGIYIKNSSYIWVKDNYVYSNGSVGMDIEGSNNITITNNNLQNNSNAFSTSSIMLWNTEYSLVENNNITDGTFGIRLYSSANNNVISGNYIKADYGMSLGGSHNNTITGNNIYNCASYGIYLGYVSAASYNTISSNIFKNNTNAEIYIKNSSSYNNIVGNNIQTDTAYGIQEDLSVNDYNSITNNTITGATVSAVLSLGIHDTVSGNKTSDTAEGIFDIVANADATQTALKVTQNGTGNIVDFKDGATSVFTISDGGNVMMTGNLTTPSINNIIYVDGTTYAQTSAGIQAAIDALPSTGGKVVLPAGTYNITATINIAKSNVTLEGVGESTILYLADGTDTDVLKVGDGSNTYSGIEISKFKINGNKVNNTGSRGIVFDTNISDSNIDNLNVYNCVGNGINVIGSTYIYVRNNNVNTGGTQGIFVDGGSNITVSGNTLTGNGLNYSIILWNTDYSSVENNNIDDNGVMGIVIYAGASNNVVSGNYIHASVGIVIGSSSINNTITGNSIYDCGSYGIWLGWSAAGPSYNTISSNTLKNNKNAEIYLSNSATYNNIIGNNIQTTAAYGIQEASATEDFNSIVDNTITGATTLNISAQGPHTTVSGNKTSSATEGLFDIVANSGATQAALQVTQNGTGNIVDFKDGSTSVFTISDGGNVVMTGRTFEQVAVDPVLKGSLIDSVHMNGAVSVFVSGKYAFVAGNVSDSLAIIDIFNPDSPVFVSYLSDSVNMNYASSVFVSGKYAFVVGFDSDSLAIIDISDPTTPVLAGSLIDATNMNGAISVYVSGRYAFVAGYNSDSLAIIDISDPTTPVLAGSLIDATNMDYANSVYVRGEYAYVASINSDSLAIIDISDPTTPVLAGSLIDATNMNGATSIYVSGEYAFITGAFSDSLAIIDISDPTTPVLAGSLIDATNMNGAWSVYVSGKYAYLANRDNNSLAIIDISDPTTPVLAGSLIDATNMNYIYSVYVSGKYAYATGMNSDSLAILDISGFDIPTANIGDLSVSTIDIVDNATVGNNLYVGNGLNVGPGGIFSDGPLAGFVSSEITALTISQNGNGDLVDFKRSGTSIFKVGQATVEVTQPLDLQVEGDVGIEYNLEFMNTSTSYIHSAGPFVISAGDSNSYENLTLTTSGTGDVIVDIASSLSGFRVVGTNTKVFSIDGSGNVVIGGVDSNDADLTVKRNISTQGGNLTLNSLATPAGVAVAVVGTAGSTTYGYRVTAINGNGETLASATVEVTTGNATLTASAYNRITWTATAGATGYKIYGRTSGSELYMATVNVPTLYYTDTGAVVTPAGELPTANTTGGSINYPNSGGPVRSLILTPSGATIPTSDGASQVKIDGANHTYYVLDFDDSTDESAYWHWTMPDSYDGGTIDVTYYWETTATSGDTIWCFQTVGIEPNNSEDIDTALSTAICETDTAQADANDLASVTESLAASGFVAGDYVAFKVYRDADDGSDTLTGDARLVKIKVEYHVSSESD